MIYDDYDDCDYGDDDDAAANDDDDDGDDDIDDYIDDVYYYLQYIKYGFGRAIRDASRHNQLGYLSKKEALEIILKYDGEYPGDSIEKSLRYWDISKEKFNQIVDNHRSSLIWEKTNNCWEHKFLNNLLLHDIPSLY